MKQRKAKQQYTALISLAVILNLRKYNEGCHKIAQIKRRQDLCKRVIKKKDKKTQTIVTQARAREIVFNSDLTSKILDFMGYSRASQSQYLILKLKRSGSKVLKGKDTPLSRVGVINVLRNCTVRIPYNLHQNKNSKHGGRHLFKQFVRTALIPKKMYDEGMIRVMMGHTPRDSDERYANQVDIELAFLIVENTFVDA